MSNCAWCGSWMQQPYRMTEFCSARCKQEHEANRSVKNAEMLSTAANLIMGLTLLAIGIVHLVKWIAPHVGRESLISLRRVQLKIKKTDLRSALTELGKAISSDYRTQLKSDFGANLKTIDSLTQQITKLETPSDTKSLTDKATDKGSAIFKKQKLSAAYRELGAEAIQQIRENLEATLSSDHMRVLQRVVNQMTSCQNIELEINELAQKRYSNTDSHSSE